VDALPYLTSYPYGCTEQTLNRFLPTVITRQIMLKMGLDLQAIADGSRETFNEIIQKCSRCGVREACAVDLKRDPNNPVWETYCPNANALLALAQARWDVPSR